MALEELQNAEDTVVESNSTKVVYTKELEEFIGQMTLDYSDSWFNKGFRLTNSAN
ncbi:MAG: hypothetical protein QM215_04175 [Bacillota bacterium]|nr:hypothetical protein [Eubacteriales bacterium]MDD4286060.1 hypothetical protein [Eubacteriales bacterium]MDI9492108.1 hypothetical protein [Bacillota bacterium]NLV69700.1 hypothetical protein [Clostridiales bacterium]HPF19273.1 hypothetical protein [Bacillota bacterium]